MDASKYNEVQFQIETTDFIDSDPHNIMTELQSIAQLQKSWIEDLQKISQQGEQTSSRHQDIIHQITNYYKAVHNEYLTTKEILSKVKKSEEDALRQLSATEGELRSLMKVNSESEARQNALVTELKAKGQDENKYIAALKNLRIENKSLATEREQILLKNDNLSQKIKNIEQRNFELQEKVLALKGEVDKWNAHAPLFADLKKQNSSLRELTAQLQSKVLSTTDAAKQSANDLEQQKQAQKNEFERVRQAYLSLTERYKLVQNELQKSRAYHEKVNAALSELRTQKDAEVAKLNSDLLDLTRRSAAQQNIISDKSASLESARDALNENESKLTSLQSALSSSNTEISRLQAELDRKEYDFSQLEAEIAFHKNSLASALLENTKLSSEVDSFKNQLQLKNENMQLLSSKLELADRNIGFLETKLSEVVEEAEILKAKNLELRHLNSDLEIKDSEFQRIKTQSLNKDEEISNLRNSNLDLLQQLDALQEAGRDSEQAEALTAQNAELQAKITLIESKFLILEKDSKENEIRLRDALSAMKTQEQMKEHEATLYNAHIDALKEELRQSVETTVPREHYLRRINEQTENLNTLNNQLQLASDKIKTQEREAHMQSEQIEDLKGKLNRLTDLLDAEKAERTNLVSRLQNMEALNREQENKLQKLSQSQQDEKKHIDTLKLALDAREQQLNFYSQNINSSKRELKEQISRFEYELQMAKSLNPMADILKITEKEIDRFEQILKKTPTISSERQRLEDVIDELFEQKRFLKANMGKVFNDIEHHQYRIRQMGQSSALKALPPPPPFEKDKAP